MRSAKAYLTTIVTRLCLDRLKSARATREEYGSQEELTSLLAADVGFWSDGGGKVLAARRAIFGREPVVNLPIGIRRTAPATGVSLESVALDIVEVNGEPAVVLRVSGRLDSVYVPTVEGDAITALRVVRNPDKLTYIQRQLGAH